MSIKKQRIMLLIAVFGVQDLGEVERYPDVNVGRGGSVSSNILEEKFRFHEVEALRINEL